MNSGDARYFSNSDSQSAAFIGGREPVTGRHSVILSLSKDKVPSVSGACLTNIYTRIALFKQADRTHPDSVRRVNPPKTTMPKTLAALPKSHHATDLSLILGKLDLALTAPSSTAFVTAGAAADFMKLDVKNWRFFSVKKDDRILFV